MDAVTLEHIKDKLKLVPLKPGCYQMYDKNGTIIYVGKAKILQNRLRSYFTGSHDAKTTQMVSKVNNFEYIITKTETEAFLLEHNLIKQYRPFYNIMLMDDKTYPYILITGETNPRVLVTRDIKKIKKRQCDRLFGPYPNVKACRDVIEMVNKVYPFRKCNQIPKKKCLYYDMGQCLGPCINKLNRIDYFKDIDSVTRFLNGNNDEMVNLLKQKMEEASENLEFEKAIEYRNLLDSASIVAEKQSIDINDGISRDIFGYYINNDQIAIQVLHMRHGRIIERSGEIFDLHEDINDVLLSYIYSFYDLGDKTLPQEILIPYIEDYEIVKELLNVKMLVPVRGIKKKLVDMVSLNAKNNLQNLEKLKLIKISKTKEPLEELATLLNINYPKVIELFDNSNIQGTSPVSAMVVYVDGMKSPKDYRKYNIKTVVGPDDYHTMQEVLTRRYTRVINDQLRKPNLVIVDGGLTQVNAAKLVFNQLKINDIDLIGLEKDDHHRTSSIVKADGTNVLIDKHSNLFLLLESMQDEVHRFAVTFFKEKHTKNTFVSLLDNIKGLGKKRKLVLLENFSSLDEIKNVKKEKLKSLGFPEKVASELINELNK